MKFAELEVFNQFMPVTNISYKLRQNFLQTGMLYRGGGGEILGQYA